MTTKKNTSKGIVSWPEDERPRERLLSLGPQAMTDAELIAILVRVGLKGISAVELGRQLLNRFGGIHVQLRRQRLAGRTGPGSRRAVRFREQGDRGVLAGKEEVMKQGKVVIEKYPDGYVAYPVGIKGVVVGEGDSYDDALQDVQSALKFHLETFGTDVLDGDETPVPEAFVAETSV
jgi:predicted RNase H-like HicB family nuclease